MTKKIISLAELATYLDMSQASIYHLVAEGKIPGIKIGKQWRFSTESIDKWLDGSKNGQANVLVVEDDPVIRNLVVKVLSEAGHRVAGTDTVADSLRLLDEIDFDLVLLDLLLPDGSGLDVVTAAKQFASPPDIVVVTGHPDHELIDQIRALLPYVTVLNKPIRLEALLQLASKHARQPQPAHAQG